jgi:hypothetical protein
MPNIRVNKRRGGGNGVGAGVRGRSPKAMIINNAISVRRVLTVGKRSMGNVAKRMMSGSQMRQRFKIDSIRTFAP